MIASVIVTRLVPLLLAVAALSACKQGGADNSDAPVPIQPGTVSDAMPAFDRVRSEAPLANPGAQEKSTDDSDEPRSDGSPRPTGSATSQAETPEPVATLEATPSATPTAEAD